jgi:hypothetical protein
VRNLEISCPTSTKSREEEEEESRAYSGSDLLHCATSERRFKILSNNPFERNPYSLPMSQREGSAFLIVINASVVERSEWSREEEGGW